MLSSISPFYAAYDSTSKESPHLFQSPKVTFHAKFHYSAKQRHAHLQSTSPCQSLLSPTSRLSSSRSLSSSSSHKYDSSSSSYYLQSASREQSTRNSHTPSRQTPTTSVLSELPTSRVLASPRYSSNKKPQNDISKCTASSTSSDSLNTTRKTTSSQLSTSQITKRKQLSIENSVTARDKSYSANKQHQTEAATPLKSPTSSSVSNSGSSTHRKRRNSESVQSSSATQNRINPRTAITNTRGGIIKAYAAHTDKGLVRNYNEDRVSIILNILKPAYKKPDIVWPRAAFFGVFDGHGGSLCADFLRDNLHHFVVGDEKFPEDPRQALVNGFARAEREFLSIATSQTPVNTSGSCATVVLLVNDVCYVANLGDSRAVLSLNQGHRTLDLSKDHKPSDPIEQQRIMQAGGSVYQHEKIIMSKGETKVVKGPMRTSPGGYSVSRAFGDIKAKLPSHGGMKGVITADPEFKIFKVQKNNDFIFLACDGIYDTMSSEDVVATVWKSLRKEAEQDVHNMCSQAVESVISEAISRKSADNLTGLMISFTSFQSDSSTTPTRPTAPMTSTIASITNTVKTPSSQQPAQSLERQRQPNSNNHANQPRRFSMQQSAAAAPLRVPTVLVPSPVLTSSSSNNNTHQQKASNDEALSGAAATTTAEPSSDKQPLSNNHRSSTSPQNNTNSNIIKKQSAIERKVNEVNTETYIRPVMRNDNREHPLLLLQLPSNEKATRITRRPVQSSSHQVAV